MASSSVAPAAAVVSKAWSCQTLSQASSSLDADAMMETAESIRELLTQSNVNPKAISEICKSMYSQETVPASIAINVVPATPSPHAPMAPKAPEASIVGPVKVEDQVDLRGRIAHVKSVLAKLTALHQHQAFNKCVFHDFL